MLKVHLKYWYGLLIFSMLAAVPATSSAEQCDYPGHWGGPFPGTPECTEGFKTEPLTCCDCEAYWPDRDERIRCTDEDDCVSMVGKYMTCGGPIGPFLVDDQDNVYFWSGRWNLHALDSRGNLRWRFDLCHPPEDSLCGPRTPDCRPNATRVVPMVMDYHETLFFFIGNVLYAISSGGELLLKHRVVPPELQNPDQYDLSIATGGAPVSNITSNHSGRAVLHRDGTLSAAYVGTPTTGSIVGQRDVVSGVVHLERDGRVLDNANSSWIPSREFHRARPHIAGRGGTRLAYSSRQTPLPFTIEDSTGLFISLWEYEADWEDELTVSESLTVPRDYDVIEPALAVDGERTYGLSSNGAVWGFDETTQSARRLFHFYRPGLYSWQTRPVVAPDGMLYFAENRILQGGALWAMDPDQLWETPGAVDPARRNLPVPRDHPGLEWGRVYGGGAGYTTPALAQNGRLYAGMSGIAAHNRHTGEQIWWFGSRTMASAPAILSDGTIVVGQGITGRVYFLEEDTPNGGMAMSGWPTVAHDRYHSNNSDHPFRWDRSGEAPYLPLETLLAERPACWNEAGDWDEAECGELPPSSYPVEPGEEYTCPDTSGEDAGGEPDTGTPGDAEDVQQDTAQSRDAETDGTDEDVNTDEPADAAENSSGPGALSGGASSCSGCNSRTGPVPPSAWLLVLLIGSSAIRKSGRRGWPV